MDSLSIPTTAGFRLVTLSSIDYLQSNNTITYIHHQEGEKIISVRNIGYFEDELKDQPFLRVHNSFIINKLKIKSFTKKDGGFLTLHSGQTIPVSRNKKASVRQFLRSWSPDEKKTVDDQAIAWLVVDNNKSTLQTFPIRAGRHLVGRKNQTKPCDIMIEAEDRYMSRHHFVIEAREIKPRSYEFAVTLIGSLNTTLIDQREMKPGLEYPLKHKTLLAVGATHIQFKIVSPDKRDLETTFIEEKTQVL